LIHRDSHKAVFQSEMRLIGEKGDRAILEPVTEADRKFVLNSEETELVSELF
jgi:hypothetical protein